MTTNDRLEILELLQNIVDRKHTPEVGICWAISHTTNILYSEIQKWMKGWPHHSGDDHYPIPATRKGCSPEEQYNCRFNFWGGKQGDYRRDLCQYLIHYINDHPEL